MEVSQVMRMQPGQPTQCIYYICEGAYALTGMERRRAAMALASSAAARERGVRGSTAIICKGITTFKLRDPFYEALRCAARGRGVRGSTAIICKGITQFKSRDLFHKPLRCAARGRGVRGSTSIICTDISII